MAGRDGRGGFNGWTEHVKGRFSRRDETVRHSGRYFLGGTGRSESTVVGENVDGTGPF